MAVISVPSPGQAWYSSVTSPWQLRVNTVKYTELLRGWFGLYPWMARPWHSCVSEQRWRE